MILSKEDVLKFCIDTGIRVGQQKYQTLQNVPNVREIVPTNVFLLRRNFYLYARLQNFLKAESINIYIAKSQPFAKIVRTYTRKHANLEYDCSRNFPPVRSSELLICM